MRRPIVGTLLLLALAVVARGPAASGGEGSERRRMGREIRLFNGRVVPGKIALQSEGAEIHFRNIRLVPILRGE
jgi:hypothetical protein